MAETLDLSVYVQRRDGTAHIDLAVEGVACGGCIRRIEGSVKALPGIVDARLNSPTAGSRSTGATARPKRPTSSRRSSASATAPILFAPNGRNSTRRATPPGSCAASRSPASRR